MAVPPREPGDMGDDESHESDHAGHRDGGRREQRRRQVDSALHLLDVGAEVRCGLLAQRQQIEGTRGSEEHDKRNRRVDCHKQDGIPRRARQPAPEPQKCVPQLGGIGQRDDRRRNRGRECPDRHAAEQQNPRVEAGPADQAKPVD